MQTVILHPGRRPLPRVCPQHPAWAWTGKVVPPPCGDTVHTGSSGSHAPRWVCRVTLPSPLRLPSCASFLPRVFPPRPEWADPPRQISSLPDALPTPQDTVAERPLSSASFCLCSGFAPSCPSRRWPCRLQPLSLPLSPSLSLSVCLSFLPTFLHPV